MSTYDYVCMLHMNLFPFTYLHLYVYLKKDFLHIDYFLRDSLIFHLLVDPSLVVVYRFQLHLLIEYMEAQSLEDLKLLNI